MNIEGGRDATPLIGKFYLLSSRADNRAEILAGQSLNPAISATTSIVNCRPRTPWGHKYPDSAIV